LEHPGPDVQASHENFIKDVDIALAAWACFANAIWDDFGISGTGYETPV